MSTLYDKLWSTHVVASEAGGVDLLYIDRMLLHEGSSPQAFAGLRIRRHPAADDGQHFERLTPMRTAFELTNIGYALAVFPAMTSLAAAAAMKAALVQLKNDGEGIRRKMPIFDFKKFCGLIGFQEVWDFEKKWAR